MISKSVFIKKKRIMEQFSLEKYLANPSRKVVTRDGRNVRIVCTDMKNTSYPIVALITDKEAGEFCIEYTSDGKFRDLNIEYTLDLFFAPEKHEGWVNVYRTQGKLGCVFIYDSEKEARRNGGETAIATVKIEWEE